MSRKIPRTHVALISGLELLQLSGGLSARRIPIHGYSINMDAGYVDRRRLRREGRRASLRRRGTQ